MGICSMLVLSSIRRKSSIIKVPSNFVKIHKFKKNVFGRNVTPKPFMIFLLHSPNENHNANNKIYNGNNDNHYWNNYYHNYSCYCYKFCKFKYKG